MSPGDGGHLVGSKREDWGEEVEEHGSSEPSEETGAQGTLMTVSPAR